MYGFRTPRSAKTAASSSSSRTNRTPTKNSTMKVSVAVAYDPIDVFCRVRPIETNYDSNRKNEDWPSCVTVLDDKKSIELAPSEDIQTWKNSKKSTFIFKEVFDNSTNQDYIFKRVAVPLVQDLLDGKNGLLFAYGVSGSGKTFTMSGNSQNPGILPKCLDIVFNSIHDNRALKNVFKPDKMNGFDVQSRADAMLDRQRNLVPIAQNGFKTPNKNEYNIRTRRQMQETPRTPSSVSVQHLVAEIDSNSDAELENRIIDFKTKLEVKNRDSVYSIFITYIEIYNNYVYDLLEDIVIDPITKKAILQTKILREDGNKNMYVNGVNEIEVDSSKEALDCFIRGQKKRRIAHTALNTESSRSHSIFNIRLVQAPLDEEGEEAIDNKSYMTISQLSLVDLAGSERYGRTNATGDRLKEAGNINNSLMVLRKCMDTLRENQQAGTNKMVPYRDTKLTHYLKNYFEGEGHVKIILCVNPKVDDYDENIHVMMFAELTKEVQIQRPQENKKLESLTSAGHTPGRKRANEMYKVAKRRLVAEEKIDEGSESSDAGAGLLPNMDINMVFGLCPPIPIYKLTKPDEEELLSNLVKALKERIDAKRKIQKVLLEKRSFVREKICALERECDRLQNDNMRLKCSNEILTNEQATLESDLRFTRDEKDTLEAELESYKIKVAQLTNELENAQMEFRQREVNFHKEKDRIAQDLDKQREYDDRDRKRKLMKEQAKIRAEYRDKDETLNAVKRLLLDNKSDKSLPIFEGRRTRRHKGNLSLLSTSSESDIPSLMTTTARSKESSRIRAPSEPKLLYKSQFSDKYEPRSADSALFKRATQRRFISAKNDNDKWLAHRSGFPVKKTGTVFQPKMKHKKSVGQLTNADPLLSSNKYCLATQDQDTDGEVELRLYKGDVLPTIGGGAQVTFNSVEVLKEKSPNSIHQKRDFFSVESFRQQPHPESK